MDHILAHLYAPHLERDIDYPYLGLLVSGGHTIIARVERWDAIEVLGTTIDDACGEAFDKVAKHHGMGFPGGVAIDRLAQSGDPDAFRFPKPNLHKGDARYDVSYSGLKTAVIHQLDQFWNGKAERSLANIAASFQRTAIDILVDRVVRAAADTGLRRVVAGGGVAANSRLRARLAAEPGLEVIFPSLALCTDNAAMVAGLGWRLLAGREDRGPRPERRGTGVDVQAEISVARGFAPRGGRQRHHDAHQRRRRRRRVREASRGSPTDGWRGRAEPWMAEGAA